jgi:hypothetical protein
MPVLNLAIASTLPLTAQERRLHSVA